MKRRKTTSPVGKFYAKVAQAAFNNGWKGIHKDPNVRSWTVLTGEYTGTWTFEQKLDRLDRMIRISYAATIGNDINVSAKRRDGSKNKGVVKATHIRFMLREKMWGKYPQLSETTSQWHRVDSTWISCRTPVDRGDSMRAMLEQANVSLEEWATHSYALDSLRQAAKIWKKFSSHKDRVAYSRKFFSCHSPYAALPSWVKRVAKWKKVVNKVSRLDSIRYMPKHWNQNYCLESQWGHRQYTDDLPRREQIEFAVAEFMNNKTRWTLTRKILAGRCSFEVWNWAETNRDNIEGALGRRIRHYLENENFSGLMRHHDELARIEEARMYQLEDDRSKKQMFIANKWREECPWQDSGKTYSFVVEVLRTVEEIRKEGDRQNHCVGTYAYMTNCYLLSLLHEDGTRTTAQIAPDGKILQHQGVRNSTPSQVAHANLSKYLRDQQQ